MGSVNKVFLIGNLGGDPEVKYSQSGTPVANFSVATTETWNDRNGERQERTEWHRIVAWGKLAEICGEHLKKGRPVHIEGKIQTRTWDDRDGNKRYTTEVVANQVTFIGGVNSGGAAGGQQRRDDRWGAPSNQRANTAQDATSPPPLEDSDIPF